MKNTSAASSGAIAHLNFKDTVDDFVEFYFHHSVIVWDAAILYTYDNGLLGINGRGN